MKYEMNISVKAHENGNLNYYLIYKNFVRGIDLVCRWYLDYNFNITNHSIAFRDDHLKICCAILSTQ